MKQAAAIFLLLIFTFSLGGSYVILKFQQHQLHREIIQQIKLGIPESNLTSIVITPETQNQIIWKNREEFLYKGIMYDVVHLETKGQNIEYHCISDTQETKLIAKYSKQIQKNRKNKNNRTNPLKIFKFNQRINFLPQKEELAFSQKECSPNFNYCINYTTLSLEISSPPPKQFL